MRRVAQLALVCLTLAAGIAAVGAFAADPNASSAPRYWPRRSRTASAARRRSTTRAPDAFTHLAANAPKDRQKDFNLGSRLFAIEWVPFPNAVKIFDGLGPDLQPRRLLGMSSGQRTRAATGDAGRPDGHDARAAFGRRMAARLPHPQYGDQLNDRAIPGGVAGGARHHRGCRRSPAPAVDESTLRACSRPRLSLHRARLRRARGRADERPCRAGDRRVGAARRRARTDA